MSQAVVPDFFIGAHAAVAGYTLLTRDATRYAPTARPEDRRAVIARRGRLSVPENLRQLRIAIRRRFDGRALDPETLEKGVAYLDRVA